MATYYERLTQERLACLYLLADTAENARQEREKEKEKMRESLHQEIYGAIMETNRMMTYRSKGEWEKFMEACEKMEEKLETILKKIEESPGLVEEELAKVIQEWKEVNHHNIYIARVEVFC